jgi:hypothetical protein
VLLCTRDVIIRVVAFQQRSQCRCERVGLIHEVVTGPSGLQR